jgi:hypothetical protein
VLSDMPSSTSSSSSSSSFSSLALSSLDDSLMVFRLSPMTCYSLLDRTTTTRAVVSRAPTLYPVSVVMPPLLVEAEAGHLTLVLAAVVATMSHSPSASVEAGSLCDGRWERVCAILWRIGNGLVLRSQLHYGTNDCATSDGHCTTKKLNDWNGIDF